MTRHKKPYFEEHDTNKPVVTKKGHSKLIHTLILLLSDMPLYGKDIVKTLPEGIATLSDAPSGEAISDIDRSRITKNLFEHIQQQSIPFIEVSREPGKIVYADPSCPEDVSKQITYVWDSSHNKWQVVPGDNANAMISNAEDGQLIEINQGKATTYGNKEGRFTTTIGTTQSVEEEIQLTQNSMFYGLKETLQSSGLTGNLLCIAQIPTGQKKTMTDMAERIRTAKCDGSRGAHTKTMQNKLLPGELTPWPFVSPYDAGEFRYFWYRMGDVPVGIRIDRNTDIQVLVPENYQGDGLAVMLSKDWLAGKTTEGELHSDGGYSASEVLFINKDGSSDPLFTSARIANTQHLIPKNPAISGVVKLSEKEMKLHMDYALQAGVVFTETNQIATFTPLQENNVTQLLKKKEPEQKYKIVGSATKKLSEQRNQKPQWKLPDNINIPGFELHCAFRQDVFLDGEQQQGPLDEEGKRYAAHVYVLKKKGSDINKDRSNAFIMEISDSGEIRFRSGWVEGHFVEAKITVSKNGKEYIAELGKADEWVTHSFDENAEGTPFRSTNSSGFMCIDGCLGDKYDENNRNSIKTPSLAKEMTK